MKMRATRTSSALNTRAFTMIEIAICLAVIGFALVAIVGVLPIGMNVQKENRQETIVNQDATVFMDALRGGQRGLDELTNYVYAITNTVVDPDGAGGGITTVHWYTRTDSGPIQGLALTNGLRIVGLLSTPHWTVGNTPNVVDRANRVVAYVRSISGPANEKYPQDNDLVRELALSYKVFAEVTPIEVDPTGPTSNGRNLARNLHEVRLTFRWPILPNGDSGPGRQVYRTLVSGDIARVSDLPGVTNLYLFRPRTYVRVP